MKRPLVADPNPIGYVPLSVRIQARWVLPNSPGCEKRRRGAALHNVAEVSLLQSRLSRACGRVRRCSGAFNLSHNI